MIVFRATHVRALVLSLLVAALAPQSLRAATYSIPPDESLIDGSHAIVVGSALRSWTELDATGQIVTKTTFSIEEVLKGRLRGGTVEIVEPGGVYENRFLIIPGMPRFNDGERCLLLLTKPESRWMVYGLTLGKFHFMADVNGNEVLVRDDDDLVEQTLGEQAVVRGRRDAEKFLQFIRATTAGGPAKRDFVVEQAPLIRPAPALRGQRSLLQGLTGGFTSTSYTMISTMPSRGGRWTIFGGGVTFKTVSSNANGTTRITAAFASWNNHAGSSINLVNGGADDGTHNGGLTTPDTVNTIMFEQNLQAKYGAPVFNCNAGAWNGFIGLGGISGASGTHSGPNMETFDTFTETDVELNTGVRDCPSNDMSTGVAHEVGHAIGFRHANKTRDSEAEAECATDVSLECSASAIMTTPIPSGINAALQTWDQNAATALYPAVAPPAAPTGVVATATSSTSVSITWTAVGGATSYQVDRRDPGGAFTQVGTPATNSFTNNTGLSANTAYLYRVRAVNGGGAGANSATDLATTVIFTDDPLVINTTVVKAIHLSQLRTAVNAVRAQATLGAGSYTDAASAGVSIKGVHVTEMRTQLDAAMGALGLATGGFTDGALGGVKVKAVHFQELRNRVK